MKVFLLPSESHLRSWFIVYIWNSMNTINDLINSHFPINDSYLINVPALYTLQIMDYSPLSNKRQLSNRRPLWELVCLFILLVCLFFSGINSLKLWIPFGRVRTREKTNRYYMLSTNFSKFTYNNWLSSKNSIDIFVS